MLPYLLNSIKVFLFVVFKSTLITISLTGRALFEERIFLISLIATVLLTRPLIKRLER